jgi:hypothetical protein
MRTPNLTLRTLGLALLPLAFGATLTACAGDETEATEQTEGNITIIPPDPVPVFATCRGKAPDAKTQRGTGVSLTSGLGYGTTNCKAYVIDASPPPTVRNEDTVLSWSDPRKRTKTECEGAKLTLQLYSKESATDLFPPSLGDYEMPLTWNATQNRCQYVQIAVYHHLATSTAPESWGVKTFREFNEGQYQLVSSKSLDSFQDRILRFAAAALTKAGTPQGIKMNLPQ